MAEHERTQGRRAAQQADEHPNLSIAAPASPAVEACMPQGPLPLSLLQPVPLPLLKPAPNLPTACPHLVLPSRSPKNLPSKKHPTRNMTSAVTTRQHPPGIAQQVVAHDDNGHAGGAHVLLRARIDQAVPAQRGGRGRAGRVQGGQELSLPLGFPAL